MNDFLQSVFFLQGLTKNYVLSTFTSILPFHPLQLFNDILGALDYSRNCFKQWLFWRGLFYFPMYQTILLILRPLQELIPARFNQALGSLKQANSGLEHYLTHEDKKEQIHKFQT